MTSRISSSSKLSQRQFCSVVGDDEDEGDETDDKDKLEKALDELVTEKDGDTGTLEDIEFEKDV